MGQQPAWYRLIKAAQYLRVPPWELAEQPLSWVAAAEEAQHAEAEAQAVHDRQRARLNGGS